MDYRLIEFFGVALKEDPMMDTYVVNHLALRHGYAIHPACCTKSVFDWLNERDCNWNSTFYKTWEDVTKRSREVLAIDQIISYAINYDLGGNFDMNDGDYSEVPDIHTYKVIMPISEVELYSKCLGVLTSGLALKQETMEALCDFIILKRGVLAQTGEILDFSIEDIKNKEAQIYICDKTGILPKDKFSLLRYIVYKVTGDTQIIKDKHILQRIAIGRPFDLSKLSEVQLAGLASIFHRYKTVFLGLRRHSFPKQKAIVNRLRKMANVFHVPFQSGFWEEVVNKPCMPTELAHQLKNNAPSNFKLVRLIQSIRENKLKIGTGKDVYNMYPIRNGKVWFEKMPEMNALDQRYDWWDLLEEILYNELVERLKKKACTVKLPEHLNLACPTSEKSFIGNIPFGSNYKMTEHNMVGIYWREEWGTRDFDLSFMSYNGYKIGWNSQFYNDEKDLIYSGDMTHADPEASEVLYVRSGCPNGMIKVNRYSGGEGSKFVLMVAQSPVDSLSRNYMVDPNTIKFETEIISKDRESFIGFVNDNHLYMCDFKSGDGRVSSVMTTDQYGDVLARKAKSFIDLKKLLEDAGFKIRKRATTSSPIDLDLSGLKKDDLIQLFA